VLSAFKRAEDADALVVRLFETEGKKTAATLTLDRKLLGVVTEAREADVLERPLARSSVKVEGQKVSVELPPHGLATVLIRARK
jgi:alpha-mannosidase